MQVHRGQVAVFDSSVYTYIWSDLFLVKNGLALLFSRPPRFLLLSWTRCHKESAVAAQHEILRDIKEKEKPVETELGLLCLFFLLFPKQTKKSFYQAVGKRLN